MITTHNEPLQYQTTFTNGTHSALADTTEDKGGHNSGFRPHELLEAALASCINMHVRMYAQHHNVPLEKIQTIVSLDRSNPAQVVFNYSIELSGSLSPEQKEKLHHIAKTCPVHQTLSKAILIREG
ncbi:MAG TPA: OsmC family protein [Bacteroidota bacterium]|nr:OsmC family protein [Bacteroidota bacterium]